MINISDRHIREHIFEGNFGLEKESLRVTETGRFAHTPHPFPEDKHIVRDFCENQAEINTGVHSSAEDALGELAFHTRRLREHLLTLPEKEYLWLFSNPPYIEDEKDIPVASFGGAQRSKTLYRDYLADKYGRYKMTFSGIHFNFSFGENLLRRGFELSGGDDFRAYRDRVYLVLAKGLSEYGWILTAATAASPLLDSSFTEGGKAGGTVFFGSASVRCGEFGYWNDFVPILDYESAESYAHSIEKYVKGGLLNSPSELYVPIRLKSEGENNLTVLRKKGVDHIELRMFDLNPFTEEGADIRDLRFAHLLMIYILCRPEVRMNGADTVRSVRNFKAAARYDLSSVNYMGRGETSIGMRDAAIRIIDIMRDFFTGFGVSEILDYQKDKFVTGETYARRVREEFGDNFAEKALAAAKERK
ncbi:MAG: hypothetical protein J6332_07300 [Abditibacteriota bacterium]|nr:hypothetical protein [Abditibacteriota bacterium]